MFKSIQERKLFEVNIKHIILGRVSKAKGGEGGCGETSFGPGSDVMRLTSGCKADTAVNIVGADRGEMGF